MHTITQGCTGLAVEDIQKKLVHLGYSIDSHELKNQAFGTTTAQAVLKFRLEHNISFSSVVDEVCWAALVDETYSFGERTLYLRLPNFHGADVRLLQERLNILGFSCGDADGYYGVHTEAAVKAFQENVGILADGMAFLDTFDAIERLKHVWNGTHAKNKNPMMNLGFARASQVLEHIEFALSAQDPMTRNIAARLINLAQATNAKSKIYLCDDAQCPPNIPQIILSQHKPDGACTIPNVQIDDFETLSQRIKTALEISLPTPGVIQLEFHFPKNNDACKFTTNDAQTFAVVLLDALCGAFV